MEKFCLKWRDFETNIAESFRELREDQNHFDVTLATDDDYQIEAHKIILSSGSMFFRDILRKAKHPSPFLYLKGIKRVELEHVLDFLYNGKADVAQEALNPFLETAKDLQVKGLTNFDVQNTLDDVPDLTDRAIDSLEEIGETSDNNELAFTKTNEQIPVNTSTELEKNGVTTINEHENNQVNTSTELEINHVNDIKEYQEKYVDTITELDLQIEQMIEMKTGIWKCKVCKKSSTNKCIIRQHAEIHIQGLVHTCHICSKTSPTRASLKVHISNFHSGLSLTCDICNKTWVTRNAFNKHNRKYH